MKILAINGSPRRSWNTGTLLQKALDGAASVGAQTEIIHLYDYEYRGCVSCYSCKRMGNHHLCVLHDDLSRVLEKMGKADGIIFGSPIFFGTITSGMAACLERFLFPYIMYGHVNTFEPKKPSAFILASDALANQLDNEVNYLGSYEHILEMVLGDKDQKLIFTDTKQFESCGTCGQENCNMVARGGGRDAQFPMECQKAYLLGVDVAKKVLENREY